MTQLERGAEWGACRKQKPKATPSAVPTATTCHAEVLGSRDRRRPAAGSAGHLPLPLDDRSPWCGTKTAH